MKTEHALMCAAGALALYLVVREHRRRSTPAGTQATPGTPAPPPLVRPTGGTALATLAGTGATGTVAMASNHDPQVAITSWAPTKGITLAPGKVLFTPTNGGVAPPRLAPFVRPGLSAAELGPTSKPRATAVGLKARVAF